MLISFLMSQKLNKWFLINLNVNIAQEYVTAFNLDSQKLINGNISINWILITLGGITNNLKLGLV